MHEPTHAGRAAVAWFGRRGPTWWDPSVRDMTNQHIETLIIGAGQAGLATGYHLQRLGRPFLIVDGNERVGDNWRRQWDTLRLYSPARPNARLIRRQQIIRARMNMPDPVPPVPVEVIPPLMNPPIIDPVGTGSGS